MHSRPCKHARQTWSVVGPWKNNERRNDWATSTVGTVLFAPSARLIFSRPIIVFQALSCNYKQMCPVNWPPSVQYITRPCYDSSVSSATLKFLKSHPSSPEQTSSGIPRRSLVRIRRILDPSHPARGQCGLFSSSRIQPKTHIIDYIGEVHCQERPDSDYDLALYRSQDVHVGIDASSMGNEARFVNDYRGIRSRPNAVFEEYRTCTGELRMSVWSGAEQIRKGEEVVVSYGKPWWQSRKARPAGYIDLL